MKPFILPLALLISLILSGCLTSRMSWTNPDGMARFDRDSARCERNSERVWEDDGGPGKWSTALLWWDGGRMREKTDSQQGLFKRCMWDKGYSLAK